MLTFEPAGEEQYGLYLQLMRDQVSGYIGRSIKQLGMSWEEFGALFRRVGEVTGIYEDGSNAGFYWVEKRETILHIHALILDDAYQGRGIGRRALDKIEREEAAGAEMMELAVHESNPRARELYRRMGFLRHRDMSEMGYEIMRKQLV